MSDLLRIYMNDQLALGVLWREVARQARRDHRGTELGEALERVATGIAEDVATFEALMRRLGLPRNRVKTSLAAAAARLERLKPNGALRDETPLDRFWQLDFLAMGIDGKKLLWSNLRDLAALRERLPDVDFDALIARAEEQRATLEPFRAAAGSEALRR